MRGMVKWQPFAAVYNQEEAVDQFYEGQCRVELPLISFQQKELWEEMIQERLQKGEEISISYYNNYKIVESSGIISKVDYIAGKIFIEEWIYLDTVVNVE